MEAHIHTHHFISFLPLHAKGEESTAQPIKEEMDTEPDDMEEAGDVTVSDGMTGVCSKVPPMKHRETTHERWGERGGRGGGTARKRCFSSLGKKPETGRGEGGGGDGDCQHVAMETLRVGVALWRTLSNISLGAGRSPKTLISGW